MSSRIRIAFTASLVLLATLVALGVMPTALDAQGGPQNVVQISIVEGEFKVINRGLGLCKAPKSDCGSEVVWRWVGGDPSPDETEKIVISFVGGTDNASSCFQDSAGNPKVFYEIRERNSEVSATVSSACPTKSAWLYQISCVRTDEGSAGDSCTGIAPVDPGVVIG